MEVSVIIPVHNGEAWLEPCLESVYKQTFGGALQVSVYDDCSTDCSRAILESWRGRLEARGVQMVISGHQEGGPRGVGYAKNRAIEQSTGKYLCFLDVDDVMHPDRILKQHATASGRPNALVGSRFHREPEGSTVRYTKWANGLTDEQLLTQVYTSHGPTIIMPTWFCSREVYIAAGPWDESGKGTPEDLLFFLQHLVLGGEVVRVPEDLLMYRYHSESATFSVKEDTIWDIRIRAIEDRVLNHWDKFTIWNAGKQGRKLYRSLNANMRKKVVAFCDVDEKKIAKGFYVYEETDELPRPRVPIVHFSKASPPFIICMKQDLTGGGFEQNLASLNLREGQDFYHFN